MKGSLEIWTPPGRKRPHLLYQEDGTNVATSIAILRVPPQQFIEMLNAARASQYIGIADGNDFIGTHENDALREAGI